MILTVASPFVPFESIVLWDFDAWNHRTSGAKNLKEVGPNLSNILLLKSSLILVFNVRTYLSYNMRANDSALYVLGALINKE